MADWSANQIIQGRYRLDSLLGKGGMGSVWRAEHLQLKSMIAVKRLDERIAEHPEAMSRFVREAQASAALRSPHVVQVFDYGVDDGVAFIAMELLHGESLANRISRLGSIPPADALRFLSEVMRAVAKAHAAGIVHRDLKPDNIFICGDEPEFAKVLDFGVAKLTAGSDLEASQTRTGAVIGTPFYMSPEQAQGKVIDARSDLWALGVIAYECLTGVPPFKGESFGEILVGICTAEPQRPSLVAPVPQGFDEWFIRATQKDREARFQTAKEMAEALASLGMGLPPVSTDVGARASLGSGASLSRPGSLSDRADLSAKRTSVHDGTALQRSSLTTEQRSVTTATVLGTTMPSAKASRASLFVFAASGLAIGAALVGLLFLLRTPSPSSTGSLVQADSSRAVASQVGLAPAATASAAPAPTVAIAPAPTVSQVVPTSAPLTEMNTSPSPVVEPIKPVTGLSRMARPPQVRAKPAAPVRAAPAPQPAAPVEAAEPQRNISRTL